MKHLNPGQLAQFRETGVVFPLDILPREQALAGVHAFEALQSRMSSWIDRPQLLKVNLVSRWVHELISSEPLLDAVEDLIGPDILCWGATFFAKAPASGGYVGWHQDITYWGIAPVEGVVTAWLGLSDAKLDNGCMSVVSGSHRSALRDHVTHCSTQNMLNSGQEVRLSTREQERITHVELEPGQASIHHGLTLHGSNPNRSIRPRIGLSINYISADVYRPDRVPDSAQPVRGNTARSTMLAERAPSGEFNNAGIDEWLSRIQHPGGLGSTAGHIDLQDLVNLENVNAARPTGNSM